MTTEHWIMTVPVLSTAHLSPAVRDWFHSGDSLAHVLDNAGYMYYCGEPGDVAKDGTHCNDAEDFPELNKCLAWARHNGSNGWVRFDEAGDLIDELPQFDW
jgi:hypothetical protein